MVLLAPRALAHMTTHTYMHTHTGIKNKFVFWSPHWRRLLLPPRILELTPAQKSDQQAHSAPALEACAVFLFSAFSLGS